MAQSKQSRKDGMGGMRKKKKRLRKNERKKAQTGECGMLRTEPGQIQNSTHECRLPHTQRIYRAM